MINADAIQQLKKKTDTLRVFESYGLKPRKTGKGYVVKCPFHEDTTASLSITPGKGLWQCFGCGAAGDVFKFIEKKEGISFLSAVKKVAGESGISESELTHPGLPGARDTHQ